MNVYSSARTIIHSSSFRTIITSIYRLFWIWHFIINSTNRGCPIRIGITSNGSIDAATLRGTTWTTFTTNSINSTTYDIRTCEAIRIICNDRDKSVTLQAAI